MILTFREIKTDMCYVVKNIEFIEINSKRKLKSLIYCFLS
jgi:hypothetical protein